MGLHTKNQSPVKIGLGLVLSVGITACSSSGGEGAGALEDVQGTWVTPCIPDEDGDSERLEFTFQGAQMIQSDILYIGTTNCDNNDFVSNNLFANVVATGEVTELAGGDAKHVDITYTRATISASPVRNNLLEEQGISLQDVATANGIPDINNVPLDGLVDSVNLYSIYRVDGDELRIGSTSGVNDGSSPELRSTTLSTTTRLQRL